MVRSAEQISIQELLRKHGLLEVGTPSPFLKRRLSVCSPQRRPRRPPKIVIYGADAAVPDAETRTIVNADTAVIGSLVSSSVSAPIGTHIATNW